MTMQSLRGGNWDHFPSFLRSAKRISSAPGVRNYLFGFRILTQPNPRNVIRGGSWVSTPQFVRLADRDWLQPFYQRRIMGFRITMETQK